MTIKMRLTLLFAGVIAIILLFTLYRDVAYAGLTLMNVPFALVGVVAALMIRGYNFNVSAGIGFVSLFGVAVMSGVLLASRINQLREDDGIGLVEAVRKGAAIQLRPILMMMLVALLGLIPAARASGIGSDVQRPLATVIVGGLCSSLILTLLALYILVERRRERKRSAREKKKISAEDKEPIGDPVEDEELMENDSASVV
ncbi:MAG: efflux RND transporter permease subunit [Candidatus Kapaibacterium sp.]